jgi:uncharacterized protein YbbC (DUF1343 family)
MAGVAMVKVAHDLYPKEFRWKEPPYEYVYDRNPFDVIAGTSTIRRAIEQGTAIEDIQKNWNEDLDEFRRVRETNLLY